MPEETGAKSRAFPAVDEQVRHGARVGAAGEVAERDRPVQAAGDADRDLGKALLDLAAKHLADTRELLPEATEEAAEVALLPILLLAQFEEASHPVEGRHRVLFEAEIEPGVDLLHVEVEDLQAEVLLAGEMMVEGAFRDDRGLQERGEAEIVVAMAQQHGLTLLEQLLPRCAGMMSHAPLDRSV